MEFLNFFFFFIFKNRYDSILDWGRLDALPINFVWITNFLLGFFECLVPLFDLGELRSVISPVDIVIDLPNNFELNDVLDVAL